MSMTSAAPTSTHAVSPVERSTAMARSCGPGVFGRIGKVQRRMIAKRLVFRSSAWTDDELRFTWRGTREGRSLRPFPLLAPRDGLLDAAGHAGARAADLLLGGVLRRRGRLASRRLQGEVRVARAAHVLHVGCLAFGAVRVVAGHAVHQAWARQGGSGRVVGGASYMLPRVGSTSAGPSTSLAPFARALRSARWRAASPFPAARTFVSRAPSGRSRT